MNPKGRSKSGNNEPENPPGPAPAILLDPRSPVVLEVNDKPCPYCGALPGRVNIDLSLLKHGPNRCAFERILRLITAYPCDCLRMREEQAARRAVWEGRLQRAQIPPRYWDATLSYTGQSPYESQFIPVCTNCIGRVLDSTISGKSGLGLFGTVGTGKTYYLCATLIELLRQRVRVLFVNMPEFYHELKKTFGAEGTPAYGRLIKEAKEVSVLGIDEIGQRRLSEWGQEELYGIINSRYNHELPTLFTTSKEHGKLALNISVDIVDRLYEICEAYRVDGPSLRKKYVVEK